jgi:hypothetical protein
MAGKAGCGGRPSTFDQKAVDRICELLSDGIPLAQICRMDGMPARRTVCDWKNARPEVAEAFRHAREDGEDAIAWRMRDIARGKTGSSGDVQRDKLIIYTDFQLLSKWNPSKYGDKVETTIQGGDRPLQVESIKRVIVDPKA